MGAHLINNEFQSDKYPTCPAGKVPLSTKDPTAQDLLWEYAQRRRKVDAEFADDLEQALKAKGYVPREQASDKGARYLDALKIAINYIERQPRSGSELDQVLRAKIRDLVPELLWP